jgi:predicted AAA+ superfamily ATPase
LECLAEKLENAGSVLIRAPPASGKTSLLQLFLQHKQNEGVTDIVYVPCANVCGDTDLESLVLTSCTERGFSFKNIHEVMTGLTILVLDDAQCTWEHERF